MRRSPKPSSPRRADARRTAAKRLPGSPKKTWSSPKHPRTREENIPVPEGARKEAKLSLELKQNGYAGGTTTGFDRAAQLAGGFVDLETVRVMHAWFARHRFVSRPGFLAWVEAGRPTSADWPGKSKSRGAVAWLLWGGDAGYEWIRREGERLLRRKDPRAFTPLPPLKRT